MTSPAGFDRSCTELAGRSAGTATERPKGAQSTRHGNESGTRRLRAAVEPERSEGEATAEVASPAGFEPALLA